jgi:hypothetical protein
MFWMIDYIDDSIDIGEPRGRLPRLHHSASQGSMEPVIGYDYEAHFDDVA